MTDEQAFTAVLIQRDLYHDIADELAERIAKITGVEIGEHSSDNDPWMRAKYAADEYLATPASAGVEEFPLPDIASQIVNETCWVLVEALPEALSGHNWNNLKPALYKALKHFHASIGLQARTEGKADRGIVDSRCNYLALKDSICNKCGREHDGVLPVVNFPGITSTHAQAERPLEGRCASDSDGDCQHSQCPQLRDNEPTKSGRSCPLYNWDRER